MLPDCKGKAELPREADGLEYEGAGAAAPASLLPHEEQNLAPAS
jgi:hypothetical protein